MYTVPCEAIQSSSGRVSIGAGGRWTVARSGRSSALSAAPFRPRNNREREALSGALLDMGRRSPLTARIEEVPFVDAFPPTRHNAKILPREVFDDHR